MDVVTAAIKKAVEEHEPSPAGCIQWYVDENVIDVYAAEFWDVVGKALQQAILDLFNKVSGGQYGSEPASGGELRQRS